MRIESHPAVIEDDLPSIYAHIARDNRAAADRWLDAVEATFEEIVTNPECGVVCPARNAGGSPMRMLPVNGFSNYLTFYRIESDTVRVLYVVHGARHLPRLFRMEQRQ